MAFLLTATPLFHAIMKHRSGGVVLAGAVGVVVVGERGVAAYPLAPRRRRCGGGGGGGGGAGEEDDEGGALRARQDDRGGELRQGQGRPRHAHRRHPRHQGARPQPCASPQDGRADQTGDFHNEANKTSKCGPVA